MVKRLLISIAAIALAAAFGAALGSWRGGDEEPWIGPFPSVPGATGWVPSLSGTSVVVWAVGDGADGGDAGRSVAELVAERRPSAFLYLGDVYETGTEEEFDQNYETTFGPLKLRTAPVIGNHEWPNREAGYLPYWTRVRGSQAPRWYSFAAAGWQLIALDSNVPADPEQLRWLDRMLAQGGFGTCRLPFLHHPRFSASTQADHGDNPAQDPLWRRLAGKVPIVVAGHDHTMQRLAPVSETTQLIAGAGGHAPYPVNQADPRLLFSSDSEVGALELRLSPGRAEANFVNADETVLDHSTYTCAPAG